VDGQSSGDPGGVRKCETWRGVCGNLGVAAPYGLRLLRAVSVIEGEKGAYETCVLRKLVAKRDGPGGHSAG